MYDIGNEEIKIYDVNKKYLLDEVFQTPLSHQPDKFVGSDRIMIIMQMLSVTRFGAAPDEVGLEKMINMGLIETVYPLHDGPLDKYDFSSSQTHDRQMLYRHWANFSVWYKEVPLNVIKRYFGCEAAFYFCWVDFFNKMLILPAILGVLIVVISGLNLYFRKIPSATETCKAHDMFMCPTCVSKHECVYRPMSFNCHFARWNYMFDNYSTVVFAILMSFWATLFLNLWRRKSNILKLKWDIQFEDIETNMRLGYVERVKSKKFNYITGTYEPYLPLLSILFRVAITSAVCLLMILIDIAAVFALVALKVPVKVVFWHIKFFESYSKYWTMVTICIFQVFIIRAFSTQYNILSVKLTEFENPRTQKEFDNSVLYKRYLLSFANNYIALFYKAFFKGTFYFVPHTKSWIPLINKDTCKPLPCVVDLCIQIFFVMIFKRFAGNFLTMFNPRIKRYVRRVLKLKENRVVGVPLPQYENEYKLAPTNRYFLTGEFSEMIIQFGFVTFFVAAFPLAPLCSLLNNVLEVRLDAYKMIARYRRPVPRKVSGIGAWDGVLLGLTYASSATNAMVIAFTSDFVSRKAYFAEHSTLNGFVNYTLSAYATKDNPMYDKISPKREICYYRAMREPPWNQNKYSLTPDFWLDLTWRLFFVFIFEHIILFSNTSLSFFMPDVPQIVRDQLSMDRKLAKEAQTALEKNKGSETSPDTSRNKKKDVTQVGPIGGYI